MRNYYLFLAAILFLLAPVTAARPMSSLFAEQLGASMLEIGILTAFYSIMPVFVSVVTGRFIDKFGEKIPLMIGTIGLVFALVLPYLFANLFILYISLFILGGSQFLALVSIQNGVIYSVPIDKQDKAIGTFSLFTSVANMCGPLIGGYLVQLKGFQETYLILSLISILSIVCGFFIHQQTARKSDKEVKDINIKKILAAQGLKRIIIISMLILAAVDLFNVYYPIYASSLGFSPSEIGLILMALAMGSVLARIFLPKLTMKYGRVHILSIFMLMGAAAYCTIPFFESFVPIIFTAVILGAGLGIAQPLTILLSYRFAPQGHTGEVLSIRLAGNRLSQVISPIIFSGISILTGLGAIFVIESLLLGFGAFFSLGLNKHKKQSKDS